MINKVLPPKYRINEIHYILTKIGFIKQTNNPESRLFRLFRYIVMIVPFIVSVKYFFVIFIYYYKSNQIHHYKMLLLSINNFTFFMPKIRIHANLIILVGSINVSILQFTHYKLYSNGGQQFRWTKLFEMLSGKIKPSQIGLTHGDDVMVLVKR